MPKIAGISEGNKPFYNTGAYSLIEETGTPVYIFMKFSKMLSILKQYEKNI